MEQNRPIGAYFKTACAGNPMHWQVDWLLPADRPILLFMTGCRCTDNDFAVLTPKVLGLNTPYSRKHASNRCKELAEYGVVEIIARGEFRATDKAVALLNDEFSVAELQAMEPVDPED